MLRPRLISATAASSARASSNGSSGALESPDVCSEPAGTTARKKDQDCDCSDHSVLQTKLACARFPHVGRGLRQLREHPLDDSVTALAKELEDVGCTTLEGRSEFSAKQHPSAVVARLDRRDRDAQVIGRLLDGQAFDLAQHEHGTERKRKGRDSLL